MLGEYLDAEPENIIFGLNFTECFNTVMKTLDLNKGDMVFSLSTSYPSVKSVLKYIEDHKGIQ